MSVFGCPHASGFLLSGVNGASWSPEPSSLADSNSFVSCAFVGVAEPVVVVVFAVVVVFDVVVVVFFVVVVASDASVASVASVLSL